jgi:hypothetical protein
MSETDIVIRRSGAERRAARPARARIRLAYSAGVALLAVAGCSTASLGQPSTAGATASSSGATAVPTAAASVPAGVSASVVQCDTSGTGAQLPKVAGQATLPAGLTVPAGDVVYGTSLTIAAGALFLIGHPAETSSQDCYPGTGTLTGEASLQALPDNGLYSEGELVVPAGSSAHPFGAQCRPGAVAAAGLNTTTCADVSDGDGETSIVTGTPQVSAFMFTVPTAPASGQYLEGTLSADTTKPVVELFIDNQTTGAGQAKGFSGAIACSMDSAATCAASLPYFLAQAATGSPMTAADYSDAFTQIESAVNGGSAAGTASAAPTASAGGSTGSTGTAAAGSGANAGSSADCAKVESTYDSFLAGTIQAVDTGSDNIWDDLTYWLEQDLGLNTVANPTGFAGDVNNLAQDANAVAGDQESLGVTSVDEEAVEGDVKAVGADCGTTLTEPPASDFDSGSW